MSEKDLMPHIGDYPLRQQDTVEKFHGKQLLYLSWDHHLMFAAPFCIPVPRTLPFGALIMEVLPELYGEHPEFEDIDWKHTLWFNSEKRFIPDVGKSLEHHGIGHKDLIRFRTPALEGIRTSARKSENVF
jgi:phenol hydroxylase P4 protein